MPGVYEGGLKVWEASLDLVEHLVYLKGSSSRDAAGSGLFAQDEATAVTGRRRSVLEVSYVHRGRPMFSEEAVGHAVVLLDHRFCFGVCGGWGAGL